MGFRAKTMRGLLSVGLIAGGWAGAQSSGAQAPCTSAKDGSGQAKTKNCGTPPGVSQQFPYPGDKPDAPATSAAEAGSGSGKDRFPYPGDAKPAAPKAGSAGDKFPYPGETKDSPDAVPETPDFAPDPDSKRPVPGAGGQDGSSSSSSGSGDAPMPKDDANGPGLKDEGSEGEVTPPKRRRLRPQAQKTLSDDERAAEDLSVAHFYQQSGNLNGAYLRVKDAVKVTPNDPDAHLAMAKLAEKMGKKDEAVAEYKTFLELDPENEGAKGAKKALEKLGP